MLSVTFSRAALSLADLVITDNPYAGAFHLDEAAIGWPQFGIRREYAPDSEFAGGRLLLSAVPDAGTVRLSIYAHGDSTSDVQTAMEELEAATSQWSYDFTMIRDGVSRTWPADPELPSWGDIDSGMVKAHLARASIIIPLNPETAP